MLQCGGPEWSRAVQPKSNDRQHFLSKTPDIFPMKHYGLDEGKAFLRTVALTFRVFDRRYEERPLRRMRLNARYDELGL